jgi:hypothetical protein
MNNQYFNNNPFQQFFTMPDMNVWREIFAKNMQAVTTANQTAVEWAQAAARRSAEATQKSTNKAMECAREAITTHSIEDWKKLQSQNCSNFISSALEQTKEVLEMSSKAAVEILDVYVGLNTCHHKETAQQPAKKGAAA